MSYHMPAGLQLKSDRIQLVDALRGLALLAIVLLHNLEHYNLFGAPASSPDWLQTLDRNVTDFIYFIFAGKAYATFSLLFGLSFYIQMRNARKRGCDFRARFAWRMLMLVGFSQFHALFYNGDILLLYSVCGLILIPASSWSNRTVLTVAAILLLQPYAWGKIIYSFIDPNYIDTNSLFAVYSESAYRTGSTGTFLQTLANNIWNGQLYSNFWQVEAGRLFQTPALFLLGMWIGRKKLFERNQTNLKFWRKASFLSALAIVPLYMLKTYIPPLVDNVTFQAYYGIAIPMVFNFFFMVMLVGLFTMLWFARDNKGCRWQRLLIPYGRMSLTNYIFQSIIGVTVYYHYGFDLFDKVGATVSVFIAFGIFTLQLIFSQWWLKTHRQGPLEYVWKRLTWIRFKTTPQCELR